MTRIVVVLRVALVDEPDVPGKVSALLGFRNAGGVLEKRTTIVALQAPLETWLVVLSMAEVLASLIDEVKVKIKAVERERRVE